MMLEVLICHVVNERHIRADRRLQENGTLYSGLKQSEAHLTVRAILLICE